MSRAAQAAVDPLGDDGVGAPEASTVDVLVMRHLDLRTRCLAKAADEPLEVASPLRTYVRATLGEHKLDGHRARIESLDWKACRGRRHR